MKTAPTKLDPYGPWQVIDTASDPDWRKKVARPGRRKLNRFLVVTPTNVSCLGFKPIIVADFEYLPWARACAAAPELVETLADIVRSECTTVSMQAMTPQHRARIVRARAALAKAGAA